MSKSVGSAILSMKKLPTAGPYPTGDPYLFCVYHKDEYPPGNDDMEAPWPGNGHDFNPDNPYRMYHGSKIPGFPQHPHRGFETITATIEGIIDHADSVGNGGRYGQGDLQWMTAGEGIVHSEMFPLLKKDDYNVNRFFQIWLNLPAKNKMVKPSFAMFWSNDVPKYKTNDGLATATIWAGIGYYGVDNIEKKQNLPPPDSWASDVDNDVALIHITIQPGGKITIPKARILSEAKKDGETDGGDDNNIKVNRSLFYIEGKDGMLVDGQEIKSKVSLILDASIDEVVLENTTNEISEFLLMQGKPIEEPVAQYGPFVMNTRNEIQQAFTDYQTTEFGGWPWERDDMVFPRNKGRFALFDGKETFPTSDEGKKKEEEL